MLEITIKSKHGLHARPASRIVEKAMKCTGDVNIIKSGETYNAKSIMNIMKLALMQGDTIELEVTGENSDVIEQEFKDLIEGIED